MEPACPTAGASGAPPPQRLPGRLRNQRATEPTHALAGAEAERACSLGRKLLGLTCSTAMCCLLGGVPILKRLSQRRVRAAAWIPPARSWECCLCLGTDLKHHRGKLPELEGSIADLQGLLLGSMARGPADHSGPRAEGRGLPQPHNNQDALDRVLAAQANGIAWCCYLRRSTALHFPLQTPLVNVALLQIQAVG